MHNGTNGNGHMPGANDITSPEEKASLEQALDQNQFVKDTLLGAVTNLTIWPNPCAKCSANAA